MPERHITDEEAAHWSAIARKLQQISSLVSEAQLILFKDLGVLDGRPYDALQAIEDAAGGQAYMFTPQPEWMGGDTREGKDDKIRPPHVAAPGFAPGGSHGPKKEEGESCPASST